MSTLAPLCGTPQAHTAHANLDDCDLDRRLPPEIALIQILAKLSLLPLPLRRPLMKTLLGLSDPPHDEDRPAMRTWLTSQVAPMPASDEEEDAIEGIGSFEGARQAEADQLHRLSLRLEGQSRRQRRLLEQELLLRSALPEDWHFHRAKWRYLELQVEQTGKLLAPAEAARRARAVGIHFHPDQLRPGPLARWYSIKSAIEMLEPEAWLQLLDHLSAGRPLDLVLAPGLWSHLRPWLSFLVGGAGVPFLELYAGSLPDSPPAGGRGGCLVLHSDDRLGEALEGWCRQAGLLGWSLLVVRHRAEDELPFLNRVCGGGRAREWMRRRMAAGQQEQVMPLRDFVRQVERSYILDVLGLHKGIKSRACERLQISRQTLYSKLGNGEAEA